MKITAIKQQVKNQGRYSIFVNEKYSFSLSDLALINSGLKVGQELSSAEIVKLKDESDTDKAYNRVLNLLARRVRSEWEIRDYLKRKQYTEPTTDKILNKLSKNNHINDLNFARVWVENRRLLKSTSKRRLAQELRQKRISDEIINQVLEEDEINDFDVLKDLVVRKRQQTRYKDDLKLMQYLSRQGYNYTDIKQALSGDTL